MGVLTQRQINLAGQVRISPLKKKITLVAGADVAYRRGYLYCSICVLFFPDLDLVEESHASMRERLPYVPGFLSFRELPAMTRAYRRLKKKPQLMMVDGQGIAHPRSLGLASHAGVALGLPTIGCAKSHLYGHYSMPAQERGAYEYLTAHGRKIGLVLRTRSHVKPLFVSPGHLTALGDCHRFVLATAKYRIPEPLRYAHRKAGHRAKSG
ncbi:MAG: endonuclease V [candidate division WOR-3 bacterium]|nr:MAG: endonuclease V [candidate division WOR-3 bacterium]